VPSLLVDNSRRLWWPSLELVNGFARSGARETEFHRTSLATSVFSHAVCGSPLQFTGMATIRSCGLPEPSAFMGTDRSTLDNRGRQFPIKQIGSPFGDLRMADGDLRTLCLVVHLLRGSHPRRQSDHNT
jgi:hypothetical protein